MTGTSPHIGNSLKIIQANEGLAHTLQQSAFPVRLLDGLRGGQ